MNLMQQAVAASAANTSVAGGGGGSGGSGVIGGGQPGGLPQHLHHLHQQQQVAAAVGRNPLFGRDGRRGDSLLSPNTFDPTEFPSLGQNSTPASSLSARPNYGEK